MKSFTLLVLNMAMVLSIFGLAIYTAIERANVDINTFSGLFGFFIGVLFVTVPTLIFGHILFHEGTSK